MVTLSHHYVGLLSRRDARVVVIVTAMAWSLLAAWWMSGAGPVGLAPLLLPLSCVFCALGVIDVRCRRLPNALVYPLYPLIVAGLSASAWMTGVAAWRSAAVGAGIWGGVMLTLHLVSGGRGMGMGDVKLAPVPGSVIGWLSVEAAEAGLLAAFALGGIWAIGAMIVGRPRSSTVAFGPFLLAGWAVGLAIATGAPAVG